MNWFVSGHRRYGGRRSIDSAAPRIATVAVIGIAGVVIVFTAVLSIAEGFRAAMRGTGDPQTVIVMRPGKRYGDDQRVLGRGGQSHHRGTGNRTRTRRRSRLSRTVRHHCGAAAAEWDGRQRAAAWSLSPIALNVRPQVRIVEGRMFQPGTTEIVVGRAASRQFSRAVGWLDGAFGQDTWQVVGIFEAEGSVAESEIWCDASVLQSLYRRGNSLPIGVSPAGKRRQPAEAEGRAHDRSTVERHRRCASRTTTRSSRRCCRSIIRTIGTGIAALMGLGAIFGAVNTMYSAVAGRDEGDRYAACARLRAQPGRRVGARGVARA